MINKFTFHLEKGPFQLDNGPGFFFIVLSPRLWAPQTQKFFYLDLRPTGTAKRASVFFNFFPGDVTWQLQKAVNVQVGLGVFVQSVIAVGVCVVGSLVMSTKSSV